MINNEQPMCTYTSTTVELVTNYVMYMYMYTHDILWSNQQARGTITDGNITAVFVTHTNIVTIE